MRRPWRALPVLAAAFGVAALGAARAGEPVKLADLNRAQQGELFRQVDAYARATAFLDACHRPPRMVARLAPIVRPCVEPGSFAAVAQRYEQTVANNAGAYRCRGKAAEAYVAMIEAKVDRVLSAAGAACRLWSGAASAAAAQFAAEKGR